MQRMSAREENTAIGGRVGASAARSYRRHPAVSSAAQWSVADRQPGRQEEGNE
jgi:hypothetical protein